MTTIITALQTKPVILQHTVFKRWLYYSRKTKLWCVDEIKKGIQTTLVETDSKDAAVAILLTGVP